MLTRRSIPQLLVMGVALSLFPAGPTLPGSFASQNGPFRYSNSMMYRNMLFRRPNLNQFSGNLGQPMASRCLACRNIRTVPPGQYAAVGNPGSGTTPHHAPAFGRQHVPDDSSGSSGTSQTGGLEGSAVQAGWNGASYRSVGSYDPNVASYTATAYKPASAGVARYTCLVQTEGVANCTVTGPPNAPRGTACACGRYLGVIK